MKSPFRTSSGPWAWLLALALLFAAGPALAQKGKGGAPFKKETTTNGLGLTFVKIPAGSFMMGTANQEKMADCPDCKGKGRVERTREVDAGEERCYSCGGRGEKNCSNSTGWPHQDFRFSDGTRMICSSCRGNGRVECSSCDGRGFRRKTRTEHYTESCPPCSGKGKRIVTLEGAKAEQPAHRVTISRSFHLQSTEVTQGQWKAVMGTTPWSGKDHVKEGDGYPAVYVSWEEAQEFCRKLSAKEGKAFRLPTEAEWEYACRAGTTTKYSFGDDEGRLGDYAWFDKNAYDIGEKYAHRVGTKRPNPWGLYDMHGNVWEWCQDFYGPYTSASKTDPAGQEDGKPRVFRGGSWSDNGFSCRSADRNNYLPDFRFNSLGFRVVLAAPRTP